jgi:hypothetical protein
VTVERAKHPYESGQDDPDTRSVVCVRANHPKGYGLPDGRAHGYSLLVVENMPAGSLNDLLVRLREPVTSEYGEWWGTWYGGYFEPILVFYGDLNVNPSIVMAPGVVRSIGDNRAVLRLNYRDLVPSPSAGGQA